MHSTHRPRSADIHTMTPARVLRDAAAYLDQCGWTQFVLYILPDAHTVLPAADVRGAIHIAVAGIPVQPGDPRLTPTQRALIRETEALLADWLRMDTTYPPGARPADVIGAWNDHPHRTTYDVLDALRDLADICEDDAA